MAILKWSDSLSVSIESIDNQHKKLFDLINSFYEGLNKKADQSNMIKLIHGLRDYTTLHFNKEEELMKKYSYPDFKNHKAEHTKFISTINDYMERIKSGKLIISIEITNYLKNWISEHISIKDKQYSDFFIKNGVK